MTKKNSFVTWIIRKAFFLFEDINKNLLKKVFFKKSKAALKSKYDDEIVIKFIVYK